MSPKPWFVFSNEVSVGGVGVRVWEEDLIRRVLKSYWAGAP